MTFPMLFASVLSDSCSYVPIYSSIVATLFTTSASAVAMILMSAYSRIVASRFS